MSKISALTLAKETLKIVCLACIAYCAVITACHWRGWSRGMDNLQDIAQKATGKVYKAADTANDTSTQTLNLVGSATSLIGNSTTHKDGTLFGAVYRVGQLAMAGAGTVTKLGEVADAAKSPIGELGKTAAAATTRLNSLAEQQEKAGKMFDALATVPPAVTAALAPLPGLQLSLTRTSTATGDFIGGPASALATNGAVLAGNAAEMTQNVDRRFFAPWDGKHPFRHRAGQVIKFGLGLAEPAYYGMGVLHSQ